MLATKHKMFLFSFFCGDHLYDVAVSCVATVKNDCQLKTTYRCQPAFHILFYQYGFRLFSHQACLRRACVLCHIWQKALWFGPRMSADNILQRFSTSDHQQFSIFIDCVETQCMWLFFTKLFRLHPSFICSKIAPPCVNNMQLLVGKEDSSVSSSKER